MTKLPGKPLTDVWKSLPYAAKECLTKRFAEYSACLFKNQLSGIGNIYAALDPKVDRIVSMHFFWGDHIHQDVCRGPFSSSRDWMNVRLALSEYDGRSMLAKLSNKSDVNSDDEAELDDARRTLEFINRLTPLVSQILPIDALDDEPSMLFHDDLSRQTFSSMTTASSRALWIGNASQSCRYGRRATTLRSWKAFHEMRNPIRPSISTKLMASFRIYTWST